MDEDENNLTSPDDSVIILTDNEKRILLNLRTEAAEVEYGEIEVTFQVHDEQLKHGYITVKRKRL